MNKQTFNQVLAKSLGITDPEAQRVTNTFLRIITTTLASNEEVNFHGFGTFKVYKNKPRMGTNPLTKQPMEIKATVHPKFKAGSSLKQEITDKLLPRV